MVDAPEQRIHAQERRVHAPEQMVDAREQRVDHSEQKVHAPERRIHAQARMIHRRERAMDASEQAMHRRIRPIGAGGNHRPVAISRNIGMRKCRPVADHWGIGADGMAVNAHTMPQGMSEKRHHYGSQTPWYCGKYGLDWLLVPQC